MARMSPLEIYEDMLSRCWEVDTIDRLDARGDDGRHAAVGHMILSRDGHLLTIEVGVDNTGRAFASLRMFGPRGEPIEFDVFNTGESVLAVTPENVDTRS